ncbi:MAG: PAS domain-containing protein [Methanoregula sp.]|jgi:PAS domain-containing protein
MKVVCSFCPKVIQPGETPDDPVSHGICPACYESILKNHGMDIRKFLDQLDAPVFLVDENVNVLAANRMACAMAGKPIHEIKGNLCGRIFECRNASLPGGCGKTVFCLGCAIRKSVNDTKETKKPVVRRPAVVHRSTSLGKDEIRFFVTTRIDGDVILLRLDQVSEKPPVHAQYFSNFCDSEKRPEISEPPAEKRPAKDLMT